VLADVLGPALVGVYLHGSLVLGDFAQERSDVDVLAVSGRAASAGEKEAIAAGLSSLQCPAAGGLEFHLVARDAIADVEAPAFELHVSTSSGRVVDGGSDPDLVMHYAVLHRHGRRVGGGAEASELFPEIDPARLRRAFAGELRWALQHASPTYQVLNACRALRYLDDGALCSKSDGGEWALERVGGDRGVVEEALRHRRGESEQPAHAERAAGFVRSVLARL